MAALSDHSSWVKKQGFKLPVQYIGNKRMGVEVLSESKTVQRFADSYGVLACGYPSAGSGWWRTRYLNAAWAEGLIYCDRKDALTMGDPYCNTLNYVESLSENGYTNLVYEQNGWLRNNISKKEEVFETLERLMKK
jgi:hypothetical protein